MIYQPSQRLLSTTLSSDPKVKNVLIIVFDTLSASSINFYGYPRETMPHLTRLLDRATVYHNHYASSNFTTPGTASIFTGRYPWDHQATKLSQVVRKELETRNIFSYFDQYYKQAYSHNHFVGLFLNQFKKDISIHQADKPLFLEHELSNPWFNQLMDKDTDTALLFKNLLSDPSGMAIFTPCFFPAYSGKMPTSSLPK